MNQKLSKIVRGETMDRLNPFSQATADDDASVESIVDALQVVISDVDEFISSWTKRIDHSIDLSQVPPAAQNVTPDDQLRQRIQDFQCQKRQWEEKRLFETQQIQEKADQLIAGWRRLEEEQRQFLQIKEAHRQVNRANAGATDFGQPDAAAAAPPATGSVAADTAASGSGDPLPAANTNPNREAAGREAAVRQFQRLRREIQSSRANSSQL